MSWERWSVLWRSENISDGKTERLHGTGGELPLFKTRQQARDFINEHYGYMRGRSDLKAEPHGWKMPIPVRVRTIKGGWKMKECFT